MLRIGRPRTVEELRQWFQQNLPDTDWDLSLVEDEHLRVMNSRLPLTCNICGYDSTAVEPEGQLWKNIYYLGHGCPGCSGNARQSPEQYRTRAQACYDAVGNRDDLSQFFVSSIRHKGTINCVTCNIPYKKSVHSLENTSDGQSRVGCQTCKEVERARKRMRTRDLFIEQANKVHQHRKDELGYSPYDYHDLPPEVPNHLAIRPWCNTCEDYFPKTQMASDHLAGHGCQQCAGNVPWSRERLERVIEERNLEAYATVDREQIPPDEELNAKTLLDLVCHEHGHVRSKTVGNFTSNTSGPNCTRCSINQRNLEQTSDREHVLNLAHERHIDSVTGENPYFYDRITRDKVRRIDVVDIGCRQCEEKGLDPYFEQRVSDHLMGHGCNRCNNRSFRPDKPGRYYELAFFDNNDPVRRTLFRKGGITNLLVSERVYRIRCGMRRAGVSLGIRIIAFIEFDVGQDAHDLEQTILNIRDEIGADYAHEQRFHGSTELFAAMSSPMQIGINNGLIDAESIVWDQEGESHTFVE